MRSRTQQPGLRPEPPLNKTAFHVKHLVPVGLCTSKCPRVAGANRRCEPRPWLAGAAGGRGTVRLAVWLAGADQPCGILGWVFVACGRADSGNSPSSTALALHF